MLNAKEPPHYRLKTEEWVQVWSDLKPSEIQVLYYLRTLNPWGDRPLSVGVSDVGRALGIDKSTVSRSLRNLSDKGYIDLEITHANIRLRAKSRLATAGSEGALPTDNSVAATQPALPTDNSVAATQPALPTDNNRGLKVLQGECSGISQTNTDLIQTNTNKKEDLCGASAPPTQKGSKAKKPKRQVTAAIAYKDLPKRDVFEGAWSWYCAVCKKFGVQAGDKVLSAVAWRELVESGVDLDRFRSGCSQCYKDWLKNPCGIPNFERFLVGSSRHATPYWEAALQQAEEQGNVKDFISGAIANSSVAINWDTDPRKDAWLDEISRTKKMAFLLNGHTHVVDDERYEFWQHALKRGWIG